MARAAPQTRSTIATNSIFTAGTRRAKGRHRPCRRLGLQPRRHWSICAATCASTRRTMTAMTAGAAPSTASARMARTVPIAADEPTLAQTSIRPRRPGRRSIEARHSAACAAAVWEAGTRRRTSARAPRGSPAARTSCIHPRTRIGSATAAASRTAAPLSRYGMSIALCPGWLPRCRRRALHRRRLRSNLPISCRRRRRLHLRHRRRRIFAATAATTRMMAPAMMAAPALSIRSVRLAMTVQTAASASFARASH